MNAGTLKLFRKKQFNERQEIKRKAQEFQAQEQVKVHLRTAARVLDIQGVKRGVLEVERLSPAEQVRLLEKYADRLTEEVQAFQKKYGAAGKQALITLVAERDSVLVSLARTRIEMLAAEHQPRRKVEL